MSTPLRILVIENHEVTAKFISLFLQRSGHQVTIVPDGHSALSRDDLAKFDAILSDIGLPDVNGWDLMRQLRPRTRAYAIAMSGFGDEADVQRSLASGYQYHLVKPFVPAALEEALRNAEPQP
ncbi:MAG: response regulator [Verrucomicrobia bacterium]|nr:response regulator [Verrucomicrobiota bacterium]MBV8485345.1 response regulator [Verrucomicrobiota bacterium]